MAKVIHVKSGKSVEIADGDPIMAACKKLEVPFSCEVGTCGICTIKVLKGEENLAPKNEAEEEMGLGEGQRLACQCKLNKGEIEIDF